MLDCHYRQDINFWVKDIIEKMPGQNDIIIPSIFRIFSTNEIETRDFTFA